MATTLTAGNVITGLFDHVESLLNNYTSQAYQTLSNTLAVPFGLAITLYIILMGLAITIGWAEMSMKNLIKSSLKIGFLYAAAMNWSWFSEYFIDLVNSIINTVSNTMISVGGGDITASVHGDISQGLQVALNRIVDLSSIYFKAGGITTYTPYVEGIILFIVGLLIIVVASAELLIAKSLIAILFSLAPLMAGFAFFAPTNSFFERWLGEITGNGMAIIVVSSVVGIILVMLGMVFPTQMPDPKDVDLFYLVSPLVALVFSGLLLWKAASIGRSIGGGVTAPSGLMAAAGIAGVGYAAANVAKRFLFGEKDKGDKNGKNGLWQYGAKGASALHSMWQERKKKQADTLRDIWRQM